MDKTNSSDGSLNEGRENLAAYALNALEPGERAQVERLLAVSAEARQELSELQEGAEALSLLAGDVAPPPGLKERIFRLADPDLPIAGHQAALSDMPVGQRGWAARIGSWIWTPRTAYGSASLAMAGVIALTAFLGVQNAQLSREIGSLNQEVAQSRDTVAGLQATVTAASTAMNDQSEQINALVTAMRDQRWLTYVTWTGGFVPSRWLAGGQAAPEADGILGVSNTNSRDAVFLVHGLPPLPEGKEYHLWLEGGSGDEALRHDVAIFGVDDAGQARVEFTLPRAMYEYDRAIVTMQDAVQFSPSVPTGDEVLSSP